MTAPCRATVDLHLSHQYSVFLVVGSVLAGLALHQIYLSRQRALFLRRGHVGAALRKSLLSRDGTVVRTTRSRLLVIHGVAQGNSTATTDGYPWWLASSSCVSVVDGISCPLPTSLVLTPLCAQHARCV